MAVQGTSLSSTSNIPPLRAMMKNVTCAVVLLLLAASSKSYMIHSEQLGEAMALSIIDCKPLDLAVLTCSEQELLAVLCDTSPSALKTIDHSTGDQLNNFQLSFKAFSMALSNQPCKLFMTAKNSHVIMDVSVIDGSEEVKAGKLDSVGYIDGDFNISTFDSPTSIQVVDGVNYIAQDTSLNLRVMTSDRVDSHQLDYQIVSLTGWDRALYITQIGPNQNLILNKYEDGRQIRVGTPKMSDSKPSDGRFSSNDTAFPNTMTLYLQSEMLGPEMLIYTDDSNSAFKLLNFNIKQQSVSSVCFSARDNSTCDCQETVISGLTAHNGNLIYATDTGGNNFTIVRREYLPEALSSEPKNGWRESNETSGQWFVTEQASLCIGTQLKSFTSGSKFECLKECTQTSECYAVKMHQPTSLCVLLDRNMCSGNMLPDSEWSCTVPTPADLSGIRYTDFGEIEIGIERTTESSIEYTEADEVTIGV